MWDLPANPNPFIHDFYPQICGAPVLRLGVKNKKEEQT
jgi:hypothetical protein